MYIPVIKCYFFFPELMGKVSQSHSMLNHSADSAPPPPVEYPPSSQMMSAPPPGRTHPNAAMMYPPYTPLPQRKHQENKHNPPLREFLSLQVQCRYILQVIYLSLYYESLR